MGELSSEDSLKGGDLTVATSAPETNGRSCHTPQNDFQSGTEFYAVYLPDDCRPKGSTLGNYVFNDKVEALKTAKLTKKARFKHFTDFFEAVRFAADGVLETATSTPVAINQSAPQVLCNEKGSPFRGPKPQDLVKLRKSIETGDMMYFKVAVWNNPRYLVSSGDTPSILQEGSRYNALHVAAKARNGAFADLILSTISDAKFVKLLYGDDTVESILKRIQVLVDLYLNTPDKGLNETPLHFASKFAAADVVEVLVSFPQCDKTVRNKYGQTPDMIICDRSDDKNKAELKKRISLHLENHYYVPVLRADDQSVAPQIGEPFPPGYLPEPSNDPLSPRFEIHAYAGPMTKEGADRFRKVWKTPPRSTSTPVKRKKIAEMSDEFEAMYSLRYVDPEKGLERLGQRLASQFDVTWHEYWDFLDCFVDIASEDGLNMLERHLEARICAEDADSDPQSRGQSGIASGMSASSSNGKRNLSTISDLCMQLESCTLSDTPIANPYFYPFLCVEKACNVFANRIASEVYNRICDPFKTQLMCLENQVKQLELLALSYMDDERFKAVNFASIHPRLAVLTGQKLCYFIENDLRADYIKSMKCFLADCVKAFDCFSSDDEANCYNHSMQHEPKATSSKKQLICLLESILNNFDLETEPKVELEEESRCKEAWDECNECCCVFHCKKPRKSSKQHKLRDVSKRLFVHERSVNNSLQLQQPLSDDSSDDESYFTPPQSPPPPQQSDSDTEGTEEYSDAQILLEVYLESDEPTKNDHAVYKALTLAKCEIEPTKYPNIYRWLHAVSLFPLEEMERWPVLKKTHSIASPIRLKTSPNTTSSNSWLRITGANSPRTSYQYHSRRKTITKLIKKREFITVKRDTKKSCACR